MPSRLETPIQAIQRMDTNKRWEMLLNLAGIIGNLTLGEANNAKTVQSVTSTACELLHHPCFSSPDCGPHELMTIALIRVNFDAHPNGSEFVLPSALKKPLALLLQGVIHLTETKTPSLNLQVSSAGNHKGIEEHFRSHPKKTKQDLGLAA